MKEITKKQFDKYEQVRRGGTTNMWDTETVTFLSGLDKMTILEIINNYDKLNEKYSRKKL